MHADPSFLSSGSERQLLEVLGFLSKEVWTVEETLNPLLKL